MMPHGYKILAARLYFWQLKDERPYWSYIISTGVCVSLLACMYDFVLFHEYDFNTKSAFESAQMLQC